MAIGSPADKVWIDHRTLIELKWFCQLYVDLFKKGTVSFVYNQTRGKVEPKLSMEQFVLSKDNLNERP